MPKQLKQKAPAKPVLLTILLFFMVCKSQSQVVISGQVINAANKPLAFVSIVLLEQNKSVTATTTDDRGNFVLSFHPATNTAYSVKLSIIGYQVFTAPVKLTGTGSFMNIILTEDKSVLKAVTVSSKRNLITRKADRYSVNVENSFLADGNTGLEILSKSPGIWVDNKGSIRIKGNQAVTVMINDVVQRMSEEDLAEYLKSLKSEDISKIEIIQNPGSEFEAAGSGGIIHIILKRARKNGLNGSINGQYRQQGAMPYATAGTSVDYKIKNLYLSGGGSYIKDTKSYYELSDIHYPGNSFYTNYTQRDDDASRQQYRFGITYDISKNQSAGIQVTKSANRMSQLFNTSLEYKSPGQIITGTGNTGRYRNSGFSSATFNYLWKIDTTGSTLKLIVDFNNSYKKENNSYSTLYSDTVKNTIYRIAAPNNIDIYSTQLDYTRSINSKTEIKAGLKYASIRRNNTVTKEDLQNNTWMLNAGASNHVIYHENLLMLYSSIERTIKKTNLKAGLRAEETFSKGRVINSGQQFNRNYFGIFPSLFLNQTLNEKKGTAVYLSYSRRLQRPALHELNPYRMEFNNYTALTGNPLLLPQYSNNIELGYQFLKNHSASVYITGTKNIISLLASAGSNNFIEYSSQNLNSSLEYGCSLYAPFRIGKYWSVSNNISFYNLSYKLDNNNFDQTGFSAKTIHTVAVKKIADVEAVADYRSSYNYSNFSIPSSFYFDAGVSRRIAGNKMRVKLYFADIFNTLREKELTDINSTYIFFYRKRPTRTAALSLTYNFTSGKKFTNKKIEQGNTEEKSRSSN